MEQKLTRQGEREPGLPAVALPRWLRTSTLLIGGLLVLFALVALGVLVLPGWWASLVGSWVRGVSSRGVWLGLGVGAAFTLLPLACVVIAARRRTPVRARLLLCALALVLLLPNLLTAVLALGRSDAHWVLTIEAPGFSGATLAGVVTIAVLALAIGAAWRWSRRTRRTIEKAHATAVQHSLDRAALGEDGQAEQAQAEQPQIPPPVAES